MRPTYLGTVVNQSTALIIYVIKLCATFTVEVNNLLQFVLLLIVSNQYMDVTNVVFLLGLMIVEVGGLGEGEERVNTWEEK